VPWVVGALGSRPVRSKGIGRPSSGGREPKGKRHAVDLDTGVVACGAHDSLRIFDDLLWAPEDDFCRVCEDVVDKMSP
jgi:hypothetical protein